MPCAGRFGSGSHPQAGKAILDLRLVRGSLIEADFVDYGGHSHGTGLFVVVVVDESIVHGARAELVFLSSSDSYYQW